MKVINEYDSKTTYAVSWMTVVNSTASHSFDFKHIVNSYCLRLNASLRFSDGDCILASPNLWLATSIEGHWCNTGL